MYTKDTNLQKKWQDSLSGTLGKHLNILDIKNNLDKGAAVTSKYLTFLHEPYLLDIFVEQEDQYVERIVCKHYHKIFS